MRGQVAAGVLARLHVAGLAAGRQEDEYRNQDQQRVAEQAEQGEDERQPLADGRRHARGARVAERHRQQGPQHPPAIHRERRDQVEDEQRDIGRSNPARQGGRGLLELCHLRQVEARAQHDDQHQRNHQIDGRAGERDEDLLARLLRHALQGGDAADGQKSDIGGADAVAARGEHMAELVRQHAPKQQDDEHHAVDGRRRARRASS